MIGNQTYIPDTKLIRGQTDSLFKSITSRKILMPRSTGAIWSGDRVKSVQNVSFSTTLRDMFFQEKILYNSLTRMNFTSQRSVCQDMQKYLLDFYLSCAISSIAYMHKK